MKEITKETEEVMEKATQYSFDGRKESIRSYGSYRFNSIARKYEFSSTMDISLVSERKKKNSTLYNRS